MAVITSVELGASGRYVNLGSPAALDDLGSMTLLAYVRPANAGENSLGYMFSKCPSTGRGPRFFLGTGGNFSYGSSTGSNLIPQRVSSASRTPYATWQHLAATHTAASNLATEIALYYEDAGALVEETTYSTSDNGAGTLVSDATFNAFLLNRDGLARAFVGDVAYVAVWDRVLSLAELNTAAANGPLDVPTGLVLLWANQQDLGPNALTPVDRSAFVAGSLPPNTALGGSSTVDLAGAAAASASASAEFAGTVLLDGEATAAASATGDLEHGVPLTGDATASASASAEFGTVALEGAATASASATGDPEHGVPLASDAAATASAGGNLGSPGSSAQITSVELGASGRYVNLGSPAALDDLGSMTLLAYVRPANAGENSLGYMFGKCPSTGRGPRFFLGTGGNFSYGSSTGSNLIPQRTSSASRTPYATWQHLAATHTAASNLATEIALYYEDAGALVEETTYSTSANGAGVLVSDAAWNAFLLNRDGLGRAFVGDVAYVAVWDRVLSLAELNTAAANGPLDVPTGLVLLWANQQDLGPNALTPIDRSAFVAGSLPPNTALGGSGGSTVDLAGAATASASASAEFAGTVGLAADAAGGSSASGDLAHGVPLTGAAAADAAAGGSLDAPIVISSPERGTLLLSACSVTPNGLTPTITLQSRWAGDANALGARAMYGKVTGVIGKTPAFRLSCTNFEGTISTNKKFAFSYDKVTWTEMAFRSNDASYFYFSHDSAFTGDTVYVCSQVPWLIEHTLPWIQSLEASGYVSEAASSAGNAYVFGTRSATVNELSEPISAISQYSFKVSSGAGNAPDGNPKRTLVLLGGTHASEDIGNHSLQGAVEFLVSADPQAAIVRAWFDCYVYPMVAPAGRQGGGQRNDFQAGYLTADPNRHWHDSIFETLVAHKTAVQTDCGFNVQVLLDFHGTHLAFPKIHHFVQVGSDKATWQTAIQTYRAGLTMTDISTVGTSCYWAHTFKSADFSIIPEYQYYDSYPLADAVDFGADTMRALSDIAAAGYWQQSTAVELAGAGIAVASAAGALSISMLEGGATAQPNATGGLSLSIPLSGSAVSQAVAQAALAHGVPLAGAASVALVARPDGDFAAGSYVPNNGASLYTMLGDGDADYISGSTPGCVVTLGDIADAGSAAGHRVSFRAWTTAGWLAVELRQGDAVLASKYWGGNFPTTPTTDGFDVPADAISDYTDLRLYLTGLIGTTYFSWAEFSVGGAVAGGALDLGKQLAGSAIGQAIAGATMTRIATLTGSGSAVVAASGALSQPVYLDGAAIADAVATAALDHGIPLDASAAGAAVAAADLSNGIALSAGAVAQALATAEVSLGFAIAALANSEAIAAAALAIETALAGSATAQSGTAGGLSINVSLSGVAIAAAAASAGLTVTGELSLAGDAQAQASASAALDLDVPLTAAALTVSSADGSLTRIVPLAGGAAAASMATGGLDVSVRLSATALAEALASAGLSLHDRLSGAAAAGAQASADLTALEGLSGAAAAGSGAAASITLRVNLDGAAVANAIAAGALTADGLVVNSTPGYQVRRAPRTWRITA